MAGTQPESSARSRPLSTAALVVVLGGPCALAVVGLAVVRGLLPPSRVWLYAVAAMPPVGCAAGIVAWVQSRRERRVDVTAMAAVAAGASLCVLDVVLALAFMLVVKPGLNSWECYDRVEGLVIALEMYEGNHGGLPPAETWCDSLADYVHSDEAFGCPSRPDLRSGYAFNTALSGVASESIANPGRTVTIFESDGGWNAHGGKELLPETPRHGGKDRYGFVGGHMHSSPGTVGWYERSEALAGAADIFWEPGGGHASQEPPG